MPKVRSSAGLAESTIVEAIVLLGVSVLRFLSLMEWARHR